MPLDSAVHGEVVDVGWIEADVLSNLVERDTPLVDQPTDEPWSDAEPLRCFIGVDQGP